MNTILKLGPFVPFRELPEISELPVNKKKKSIEWKPALLFIFLLAIWFPMHGWMRAIDPSAAITDESIWLQIILSLLAFLIILALCTWLLNLFWLKMGLTPISVLVSQSKKLMLWQQLAFYWALFALLLLAASACLIAIC